MPTVTGAVLDTNACLYLLKQQARPDFVLEDGLVSVVTEVELLGYPAITAEDEELIRGFLSNLKLIQVDEGVRSAAIRLRRKYRLRLGDALICGTALARSVPLVTNDRDLARVIEIEVCELPLRE